MAKSAEDKFVRGKDLTTVGAQIKAKLAEKQDALVSGTNIKTVNNTSLLGEGDITIADGKSAYQIWLDEGNTGTEADFLASLKGDTGVSADYPITIYNGLDSAATDAALAAVQGKLLDEKVTQLAQEVADFETAVGDATMPHFEYITVADKYCSVSSNKTAIGNRNGSSYALIYVANLVGKKLLVTSTQYDNISVAYVFSTGNYGSNQPISGCGRFENGVLTKKELTIPAGTKWMYVNFDSQYPPVIEVSVSENLRILIDEVHDYEKANLSIQTIETETGKYATKSGGSLLKVNAAQSKIISAGISGQTKVFVSCIRPKEPTLSNCYVITDDNGNPLQIGAYSFMRFHSAITVPTGATKIYVNADVNDSDAYVGLFDWQGGGSPVGLETLNLETLSALSGYVTESNGKVKVFTDANNKVIRIPVASIPTNKIYITAKTQAYPYNVVCVFGDRVDNSLGVERDNEITDYDNYEVTIPSGAFYVYINAVNANNPVVKAYLAPGEINDYIVKKSLNGGLWDKKAVCFGDSITWYDGNTYNWGKEQGEVAKGYESYMRELGMDVVNRGYSGGNIMVILSQIRDTDLSGYDIVTITSGANDSRYQVPTGTLVTDGSTFDETTFIGALQAAVEYVLTENPTAKILLITPIKGWIYYPEGYVNAARPLVDGDGIVEQRYADAIKTVAAYYSLPVCDWYNEAGVNILTRSWFMNDPDPDPEATPNPNDLYSLHPTAVGYKRMADILIPCLRNM